MSKAGVDVSPERTVKSDGDKKESPRKAKTDAEHSEDDAD